MGEMWGYIRVSSIIQNTERQLAGWELDRIFEDRVSGRDTNRPQLQELLRHIRKGDTLVCHSIDRLARNLDDLRKIIKDLTERGVKVQFVKENLTFNGDDSPMSNLLLSIMGAFAEFERAIIKERQAEGIAIAKASGIYSNHGKKSGMTAERVTEIRNRVDAGEPKARIARDLRISRDTLYRYIR